MNARAAGSDLLIFVHLVVDSPTVARQRSLQGSARPPPSASCRARAQRSDPTEIADLVSSAVRVFQIDVVLDNDVFASPLEFLGHREWEWSLRDRATWFGVRRGWNGLRSASTSADEPRRW